MAKETSIEYADSTLNIQMGCAGCELWIPAQGVRACYAGVMTQKYAGKAGWPARFETPKIFPDRIEDALKWPDLTGRLRPLKPWLNGLPRIIFLNDMGDTFTTGLPKDWLKRFLPKMADSPHQWLILTKQPQVMAEFEANNPFPPNVWPGVSITSASRLSRLQPLLAIKSGGPKWVSYEPALQTIPWADIRMDGVRWLVSGGLSWGVQGQKRPTPVESLSQAITPGRASFVKQLGSLFHEPYYLEDESRREYLLERKHKIMIPGTRGGFTEWSHAAHGQPQPDAMIEWEPSDKGGKVDEWPEALKVRQMPIEGAPIKSDWKPEQSPEPDRASPQLTLF